MKNGVQYNSLVFQHIKLYPCICSSLLLKFRFELRILKSPPLLHFQVEKHSTLWSCRIKEQKRGYYEKINVKCKTLNWLRNGMKGMQRGTLCSMRSSQPMGYYHPLLFNGSSCCDGKPYLKSIKRGLQEVKVAVGLDQLWRSLPINWIILF